MSNSNNKSTAFYLGTTLRQIGKLARKQFAVEKVCITPEQFGLLDMIAAKDEFIQSDLATLMDKDKSAILRHIDVLEENNLIKRVNDPADRRKKFLEVTDEGDQVLEKCRSIFNEIMKAMEKGIPAEDLEVFRNVLIKMKQNADN